MNKFLLTLLYALFLLNGCLASCAFHEDINETDKEEDIKLLKNPVIPSYCTNKAVVQRNFNKLAVNYIKEQDCIRQYLISCNSQILSPLLETKEYDARTYILWLNYKIFSSDSMKASKYSSYLKFFLDETNGFVSYVPSASSRETEENVFLLKSAHVLVGAIDGLTDSKTELKTNINKTLSFCSTLNEFYLFSKTEISSEQPTSFFSSDFRNFTRQTNLTPFLCELFLIKNNIESCERNNKAEGISNETYKFWQEYMSIIEDFGGWAGFINLKVKQMFQVGYFFERKYWKKVTINSSVVNDLTDDDCELLLCFSANYFERKIKPLHTKRKAEAEQKQKLLEEEKQKEKQIKEKFLFEQRELKTKTACLIDKDLAQVTTFFPRIKNNTDLLDNFSIGFIKNQKEMLNNSISSIIESGNELNFILRKLAKTQELIHELINVFLKRVLEKVSEKRKTHVFLNEKILSLSEEEADIQTYNNFLSLVGDCPNYKSFKSSLCLLEKNSQYYHMVSTCASFVPNFNTPYKEDPLKINAEDVFSFIENPKQIAFQPHAGIILLEKINGLYGTVLDKIESILRL